MQTVAHLGWWGRPSTTRPTVSAIKPKEPMMTERHPMHVLLARIDANSAAITGILSHLDKTQPGIAADVAAFLDRLGDLPDAIQARPEACRELAALIRKG
jgi:hypothetical protein